jgi:hypothetical protein
MQSQILYHVTPAKNLRSIKSKGLTPRTGARSLEAKEGGPPAIYCFRSLSDVEQAMMGWLGDAFDEETALALLEVDPGESQIHETGATYECILFDAIPADRLKILALDIDEELPSLLDEGMIHDRVR